MAGLKYGMVFHGGGYDVVAFFLESEGGAFDGRVVGLGASAGEDDFFGLATQYVRYGSARLINDLARFLSQRIDSRRVAELFGEVGQHGFKYFGVDRRGRGVVQVNSILHYWFTFRRTFTARAFTTKVIVFIGFYQSRPDGVNEGVIRWALWPRLPQQLSTQAWRQERAPVHVSGVVLGANSAGTAPRGFPRVHALLPHGECP